MLMKSKTYVPGYGPLDAKIAIVGEQPGKDEAYKTHRPFTGAAGENLNECLRTAKINRDDVYLTNVIKDLDAPLEEYITFHTKNKVRVGELSEKGKEYERLLANELGQLHPSIIVACGNIPLWTLTNRVGITNWRGSIIDSTLLPGIKVLPTIHPATWTPEKLRSDASAYLNKYLVVMDLKKAKEESAFPSIKRGERKLYIKPSFHRTIEILHDLINLAENGEVIDYDIETVPGTAEISCIGFASNETEAICIPFICADGDYFSLEQECNITLLIAKLLSTKNGIFRGQNVGFDSGILFRKYGIITEHLADTMITQKILYPDFCGSVDPITGKPTGTKHKGASLQFITAMWTDIPYYKDDGKQFLEGMTNYERGWQYNCLDVLSTSIAHPKQLEYIKAVGNEAALDRQTKLIQPLTYMMEHGILVDKIKMREWGKEKEKEIEEISEAIYSYIGRKINLSSPKQLVEYFYNEKGYKAYFKRDKKTNQQKVTVDEDALKHLVSTHADPVAKLMLSIRELSKLSSTYLNLEKVDPDGRMRCSYNPVGTKFSRISSSGNIYGTGINLQNYPHFIGELFIADPGYVIYEFDFAQYENRIVAYVGNIPEMIYAFEHGIDMHVSTAMLVLEKMGKHYELEQITKELRQDYGKRPNHAFNYGFGPNSFALLHELPIVMGRIIHKAYHSSYPRLSAGYWRLIQEKLAANRTLVNLFGRKTLFLGKLDEALYNAAYSCIPQGTCGDDINEHGILFTYYNSDPLFKDVELLTQIHDSMSIQIPLALPVEMHAEILIKIKRSMEIPLEWEGRCIETPVDLVVNTNLNKDKGIEFKGKDFVEDPSLLGDKLIEAGEKLGIDYCPL